MDIEEFRKLGKQMIDYAADYLESIEERQPLSNVKPNYLRPLLPDEAPNDPESLKDILADVERIIMPGVTHWHHPNFFAYYPTSNSHPAILADILSDAIGCIGFSWIASPACTELEMIMMDWLGKLIGLPNEYLFSGGMKGGGVIQGTASESTLMTLLAARTMFIRKERAHNPTVDENTVIGKLTFYTSDQAHSSVERACRLGAVKLRMIETDQSCRMKPDQLELAIETDLSNGLTPFYVCATLGTTNSCAFDDLTQIGAICEKYGLWLHVDAAYAGSAFVCPEYRHYMAGIEKAMSFNFNPHKWLLVNFDCSALWVRDKDIFSGAFDVDPLYLKHAHQNEITDYRHWQIPLGRRFRSLKLWFVMRMFGRLKLQQHIRKFVNLAQEFADLVRRDIRFEITAEVVLGLVCFRLKGSNEINEKLLNDINEDRRIHLVPANIAGLYFLRFAVCSTFTTSDHIANAWNVISELASKLITQNGL